jgi:ketosteroid isomerase-like protein
MRSITLCMMALLFAAVVKAQDTSAVVAAVDRLEKAILAKDTSMVKTLLTKDVAYGHSSGWVQTKKEVVSDMASGFLQYRSIDRHSLFVDLKGRGDKAVIRERAAVSGSRDGKDFTLELFILQLWVSDKDGWKMVMRQSAKQ